MVSANTEFNRIKRILLIAYNFPPLISPQALRWFYLSRELFRKGYEIDVLTIKMPEKFNDLLNDIPQGIKICKTFPGLFYYLTFKYARVTSREDTPRLSSINSHTVKVLSKIHLKAFKILNNLFIPDIYSEWLPFAVNAGVTLIKKRRYDVIISSSEPRVCHIIGYFLKKKSGIRWIADYGDPWIYPLPTVHESQLKKRLIQQIESVILKEMDAISVAAPGIKELYVKRYPFLDKSRISIIPQGFALDMFSQISGDRSDKFRIVYCGSFYKRLRDPMAFFEAIKAIGRDDIEVTIAGRINEFSEVIRTEFSNVMIKYYGFLNHNESLNLQKTATILLHIGNATDVQIPGKIYEYFGAGRPILCIRGNDDDLSAELVIKYNKGFVVNNVKHEIKDGIMELYDLWKNNSLDSRFNLTAIEEFSWHERAMDISNIIESL